MSVQRQFKTTMDFSTTPSHGTYIYPRFGSCFKELHQPEVSISTLSNPTYSKFLQLLQDICAGKRQPDSLFCPGLRKQSSIEKLPFAKDALSQSKIVSKNALSQRLSIKLQSRHSISCLSAFSGSDFGEDPVVVLDLSYFDQSWRSDLPAKIQVQSIYEDDDSHLLGVAAALIMKFLFVTHSKMTFKNAWSLLGASSLIAFKLSYDEELPGLAVYVSETLQIETQRLLRLEKMFLKGLDYDLSIPQAVRDKVNSWI